MPFYDTQALCWVRFFLLDLLSLLVIFFQRPISASWLLTPKAPGCQTTLLLSDLWVVGKIQVLFLWPNQMTSIHLSQTFQETHTYTLKTNKQTNKKTKTKNQTNKKKPTFLKFQKEPGYYDVALMYISCSPWPKYLSSLNFNTSSSVAWVRNKYLLRL